MQKLVLLVAVCFIAIASIAMVLLHAKWGFFPMMKTALQPTTNGM